MSRCTGATADRSPAGCNSVHENATSDISIDFGREMAMFELLYRSGINRPTRFPPVEVVAGLLRSLLVPLASSTRTGCDRLTDSNMKRDAFRHSEHALTPAAPS